MHNAVEKLHTKFHSIRSGRTATKRHELTAGDQILHKSQRAKNRVFHEKYFEFRKK